MELIEKQIKIGTDKTVKMAHFMVKAKENITKQQVLDEMNMNTKYVNFIRVVESILKWDDNEMWD